MRIGSSVDLSSSLSLPMVDVSCERIVSASPVVRSMKGSGRMSHFGMSRLLFKVSGPSCSKLTMSLVNDSLKFTSSHTQIC